MPSSQILTGCHRGGATTKMTAQKKEPTIETPDEAVPLLTNSDVRRMVKTATGEHVDTEKVGRHSRMGLLKRYAMVNGKAYYTFAAVTDYIAQWKEYLAMPAHGWIEATNVRAEFGKTPSSARMDTKYKDSFTKRMVMNKLFYRRSELQTWCDSGLTPLHLGNAPTPLEQEEAEDDGTGCLYHGCRKKAMQDSPLGYGFRFCPLHTKQAQRQIYGKHPGGKQPDAGILRKMSTSSTQRRGWNKMKALYRVVPGTVGIIRRLRTGDVVGQCHECKRSYKGTPAEVDEHIPIMGNHRVCHTCQHAKSGVQHCAA